MQKSATSGVLGAGGVHRVGLVCASGNTQDLPPDPGAAPPAAGKGHGGPGPPRLPKVQVCFSFCFSFIKKITGIKLYFFSLFGKGTSWRALREGGGAPGICCSEDPVLGGGSNIHRIRFSEDPTLRVGSAAWRTQLKEEGPVFGGSSSQRIQLGGGSSTQRIIWCSEDPVLEGSNSRRKIQLLEEDRALRGSSSRKIQFLEDPAVRESSSGSAWLLEEDPVLSPLMLSQPTGWADPCAGPVSHPC